MNKHPLENGPILLAGCSHSSRIWVLATTSLSGLIIFKGAFYFFLQGKKLESKLQEYN